MDDWAAGPEPGDGAAHAARFVLAVWDGAREWGAGRFEVVEAMAAWDLDHREAFLAWARGPWWA